MFEDRTGLTGRFDFTVKAEVPPQSPAPERAAAVMTALKEQLGLRLQPFEGSLEFVVIDHIERPLDDLTGRITT